VLPPELFVAVDATSLDQHIPACQRGLRRGVPTFNNPFDQLNVGVGQNDSQATAFCNTILDSHQGGSTTDIETDIDTEIDTVIDEDSGMETVD
jgi:hypothetical protein